MTENVRAIVATNAFGMGIDKPNVRARGAPRHARHARGVLPGSRTRRARRTPADVLPAARVPRSLHPRVLHQGRVSRARARRRGVRRGRCSGATPSGEVDLDAGRHRRRAAGQGERPRRGVGAAHARRRPARLRSDRSPAAACFVRLLATAERIKRELGKDDALRARSPARDVARGRRRAERRRDDRPRRLPPGFGGAVGAMPLLDALSRDSSSTWHRLGGGASLTSPTAQPLTAFRIDWATLDRRRKAELAKLDAMQQYAYTKGCRRGFVLRYFGDPAARQALRGCDNCLGTHVDVEAGASASVAARASVRAKRDARRRRASVGRRRRSGARARPTKRLLARLRDSAHARSRARTGAGVRGFPGSDARRDGGAPSADAERAGRDSWRGTGQARDVRRAIPRRSLRSADDTEAA